MNSQNMLLNSQNRFVYLLKVFIKDLLILECLDNLITFIILSSHLGTTRITLPSVELGGDKVLSVIKLVKKSL